MSTINQPDPSMIAPKEDNLQGVSTSPDKQPPARVYPHVDEKQVAQWLTEAHREPDALYTDIQTSVQNVSKTLEKTLEKTTTPKVKKKNVVLIIEVVLGNDRKESIHVMEGDTAAGLALAFAAQHTLPPTSVPTLQAHIEDQLQMLDDEENSSSHEEEFTQVVEHQSKNHRPQIVHEEEDYHTRDEDTSPVQFQPDRESQYEQMLHSVMAPRHSILRETLRVPEKVNENANSSSTNVFNRLFNSANSKSKWLLHAQELKTREEDELILREKQKWASKLKKSVKSDTSAFTQTAVPVSERLYQEGLQDKVRRDVLVEKSRIEARVKWECPKCTFANMGRDTTCQAEVGLEVDRSKTSSWMNATTPKYIPRTITRCGQEQPALFHVCKC